MPLNTASFIGFLEPSDPRWLEALSKTNHDFFHLPGYLMACAQQESGLPLLFLLDLGENGMLVPLIRRGLDSFGEGFKNYSDVSSPYGYPAPLYWGEGWQKRLPDMHAHFEAFLRQEKVVSLFLRLNPFLGATDDLLEPLGGLSQEGPTVYIDLRTPEESWKGINRQNRSFIRNMLEHGHTVLIDRWDTMDQVIVAYYETMERLAASPFYFFPREFFRKLCENTAPHIHLATAYTPSHEISGGCFFSEVGGLIQYYLMGTLNAFMDVPPAKILINALRLWGIDHGHHTLNLGGGVGAKRDSLFEFKVRLSKSVATFSTVRKILLPEIYLALTHSFSWEAPDEDFFPTYRNSRYGQDVTSPASITCGVRRKSEISENPAVLEIAPAKKAPQNILITSAGRRTSLLQAFQQAARPYGSKVMAADVDPLAPCCTIADSAFKVPKLSDPSYLDALLSIVRDQEVGLIVPTIDTELSLLAKHVETFHKEGTLALISTPSFIAACGDKWNTFSIFKAEGVRMPASWIPECLPSNPPEHLFVKPRDGSSSINAYSCHRDDLAHVLSIVPNPIIQELLTGKEITMDACLDFQGTPLHYVPRERIRTLGGESIQGVTIEISGLNAWIESVLTVCGRLGAIGPITLQAFLSDTGPVLTEVNPRFGGGFPLALAAGGEYPAWILSLLHGEPVAPSLGQYRRGLYMTRHYTETFLEALPWDR